MYLKTVSRYEVKKEFERKLPSKEYFMHAIINGDVATLNIFDRRSFELTNEDVRIIVRNYYFKGTTDKEHLNNFNNFIKIHQYIYPTFYLEGETNILEYMYECFLGKRNNVFCNNYNQYMHKYFLIGNKSLLILLMLLNRPSMISLKDVFFVGITTYKSFVNVLKIGVIHKMLHESRTLLIKYFGNMDKKDNNLKLNNDDKKELTTEIILSFNSLDDSEASAFFIYDLIKSGCPYVKQAASMLIKDTVTETYKKKWSPLNSTRIVSKYKFLIPIYLDMDYMKILGVEESHTIKVYGKINCARREIIDRVKRDIAYVIKKYTGNELPIIVSICILYYPTYHHIVNNSSLFITE